MDNVDPMDTTYSDETVYLTVSRQLSKTAEIMDLLETPGDGVLQHLETAP